MIYSRIAGTGSYLPAQILTNHDLAKRVETSHEWIVERTGIHQRHIAAEDETTSQMAAKASKAAIEAAAVAPTDIELIIFTSTTPDKALPTSSCLLQAELNIPGVPVFDLAAACAGFIYGLAVADQFIRSGTFKTILVVGADRMSSIIDWQDRGTCVLFGDGAGAVVLQASDTPGVLSTHIKADGRHGDKMYIPTGFSNCRREDEPTFVHMQGQDVFRFAVQALGEIAEETLKANQLTTSDIDWLVPHQANARIISATAKRLGFSMDKVILTLAEHANTSAASVPLALDKGIRDGRIKRGQLLLLEAFGGSFVWGSALVRY